MLRTIDKAGGLDGYLLGAKEARVRELGVEGWRLRWRVMQSAAVRRRFAEERRRLGLVGEEEEVGKVGIDGRMVGVEAVRGQVEEFDRGLDRREGEVVLGEEVEDEDLGRGFMQEEIGTPEKLKIKL